MSEPLFEVPPKRWSGPSLLGPEPALQRIAQLTLELMQIASLPRFVPKLVRSLTLHGVSGTAQIIRARTFPKRAQMYGTLGQRFKGLNALEIGGPSGKFARTGLLPVYSLTRNVDNVNFGQETIWEGEIKEGRTFIFDKSRAPGRQFISEATDLSQIPRATYDAILSSHTLEHVANPIRALKEWQRVAKPKVPFLLIVPEAAKCFDRLRPITTLEHLRADYRTNVGEDDLTHLQENVELRDYTIGAKSTPEENYRLGRNNFQNRCLHHHTFTPDSFIEVLKEAGLHIIASETQPPHHIIVLAEKLN